MMRKTIHLVPSEDAGWIVPLFSEQTVRWSRKRLHDFGLDARDQERALSVLHRAVERDGPLTRPELAERLTGAGFEAAQEIKVHLWLLATLDGELCLGPDRGGQTCLVPTREWLGEPRALPRPEALAELARRYLRGYGPASDRDFARWAGLPLRDARSGFERIAAELEQLRLGDQALSVLRSAKPRAARGPVVRMLGAFDNYNMGYVERGFALGAADAKRILPGGGIVRPTITVDGRFVGTWSSKRSGSRLEISVEPFIALESAVEEAIAAELEDIRRFEAVLPG